MAVSIKAIGKKNWLFIGPAEAGQRSAIIYTVIESCRRRGLALTHISVKSSRLPNMTNRQTPEIVPAVWGKTQRPLQVQPTS